MCGGRSAAEVGRAGLEERPFPFEGSRPLRQPPPPAAAAISFIDAINRGDLDALTELMTEDHTLVVLDEQPLVGRDANREAWRGYLSSFPTYVIHPRALATVGNTVAVLGTTTGSHLGLADEEEMRLDVIWVAEVIDRRVSVWRIAEDSSATRARLNLPASV